MAMAEDTLDSISQEENDNKVLLWQQNQCPKQFMWQEKETQCKLIKEAMEEKWTYRFCKAGCNEKQHSVD